MYTSTRKKNWKNNFSITKHTNDNIALLRLKIINKHKFIGNLLQVFIILCSEESNLNVGWLLHTVFLDCDTHSPHVVCCSFIYSFTDVEHLIHCWFFARFGFIYRLRLSVYRARESLVTQQTDSKQLINQLEPVFTNIYKTVQCYAWFDENILPRSRGSYIWSDSKGALFILKGCARQKNAIFFKRVQKWLF